MVKKIMGLMIVVLLLFSLAACNPSEKDEMDIPFELSDKTMNYFDTDGREVLMQIVNSLDELTQLLVENEFSISPMYEEFFFDDGALVLYGLTHPKNWQYSIDKITIEGTKLFLHQILDAQKDASGALIGVGVDASSFFLIEVNKADVGDAVELEIKTTTK